MSYLQLTTLVVSLSLALPFPIYASKTSTSKTPDCPQEDTAVTVPAPVDVNDTLAAMKELKTLDGSPALDLSKEIETNTRKTFDTSKVKTKMEQFYRLLYFIQAGLDKKLNDGKKSPPVHLDPEGVQKILIKSAVFSQPDVPSQIAGVAITRANPKQPRYEVKFKKAGVNVKLNKGEGFLLFRNGKCQHAKSLIFADTFSFTLRLKDGNIIAQNFKGVDLFGDFGSRGIVDVDLEYVRLQSVEFYHGTQLGKVVAYVSREEFKKNDHNFLLRFITRFVPDKSVQPIDW